MITVSTISDAEAQAATYALEDGLPAELPYRVYLHGNLFSEKPPGGRLVSRRIRELDGRSLWRGLRSRRQPREYPCVSVPRA